jgi:hypothetical protein
MDHSRHRAGSDDAEDSGPIDVAKAGARNRGQTEAVIATRRITSTLGQQPGKHKSAQRD